MKVMFFTKNLATPKKLFKKLMLLVILTISFCLVKLSNGKIFNMNAMHKILVSHVTKHYSYQEKEKHIQTMRMISLLSMRN